MLDLTNLDLNSHTVIALIARKQKEMWLRPRIGTIFSKYILSLYQTRVLPAEMT